MKRKTSVIENVIEHSPKRAPSDFGLWELVGKKARSKGMSVVLGKTWDEQSLVVDFNSIGSMWVGGAEGTGKTSLVRSILFQLVLRLGFKNLEPIIISANPLEYQSFGWAKQLSFKPSSSVHDLLAATEYLLEVMDKNYALLAEVGAPDVAYLNMHHEHKGLKKLARTGWVPYTVLFVDGYSDVVSRATKKQKKAIEINIVKLLQMGRAAGVHLVLCTRPIKMDMSTAVLFASCSNVASFKVSTKKESLNYI